MILKSATLSEMRAEVSGRDPSLKITPDGEQSVFMLLIQNTVTLGSDTGQDVQITTLGIAPQHARLTLQSGTYRINDLTGARSLLVNGQPKVETLLHDNDIVRLKDDRGNGATLQFFNPIERALGRTDSLGKVYPFEDRYPFIIGRNKNAAVPIEALSVSWNHAQITHEGDRHVLTDLGSTNGTFVNERRLTAPYRLQMDDVIRIDKILLIYKGNGLQRLAAVQQLQVDAMDLGMTYQSGFPPRPVEVMRDVTVAIDPKEFVAVIGGSGSGKSTLLRALNGANRATKGKVLVNGEDLYAHYGQFQPAIGYVPQQDIVQNKLTVQETLYYSARLRFPNEPSSSRAQRIERALQELELTDFRDRLVGQLSGGQRKRVSVALELMAEPRMLFLDEPSSGLDPGLDRALMEQLRRLADRGCIVIVVTHTTLNIDLCDQVAFMARGELVYYGPPAEAKDFFGVQGYPEMYLKVTENPPGEESVNGKRPSLNAAAKAWSTRYKADPDYQKYVKDRIQPAQTNVSNELLKNRRLRGMRRGTLAGQLQVLIRRTLALVRRDFRTILALMLVLPLVGLFLGLISMDEYEGGPGRSLIQRYEQQSDYTTFYERIALEEPGGGSSSETAISTPVPVEGTTAAENAPSNRPVRGIATFNPAGDAQRLLFMAALAVTLLGIFASAYTIVEERAMFMRERMVNLRVLPYVISKAVVYSGLSIIACALFLAALSVGVRLPERGIILPGVIELFITLALTAIAGVSIGIFLSAISNQINGVTYLVLGVLFVQILFPGVLFEMQGGMKTVSQFTITRWSLEALGGTVDMEERSAEGKIIAETPLINPKTNKIIRNNYVRQVYSAPDVRSVDYPTQAGQQLIRWGVLLGFSVLLLAGAGVALNRRESF